MFLDEKDGGVELVVRVVLFAESMPFVGRHQVPDSSLIAFYLGHNLVSFAEWNPRIVATLDDEERFGYFLSVVQRGHFLEELRHVWIAFIAVFDAAQIAAVAFGVLQKGAEVRDANDIEGACDF